MPCGSRRGRCMHENDASSKLLGTSSRRVSRQSERDFLIVLRAVGPCGALMTGRHLAPQLGFSRRVKAQLQCYKCCRCSRFDQLYCTLDTRTGAARCQLSGVRLASRIFASMCAALPLLAYVTGRKARLSYRQRQGQLCSPDVSAEAHCLSKGRCGSVANPRICWHASP